MRFPECRQTDRRNRRHRTVPIQSRVCDVGRAAPIPVWSGHPNRYRLNRGGNRQANAALHRIAITQLRIHPDAQAYIQQRIAAGN